MRSADAPEQAVLALDLPAGAELGLVAGGDDATGAAPGSAQVVAGDDVLAVIQPPVAWDADHEPLEGVRYSVDGDKLVVHYPHRSADVLYPLAVDPAIDRFRQNSIGDVDAGGSWVIGRDDDIERSAWNYGFGGYNSHTFGAYPAQLGYTYDHTWVLALDNQAGVYYADNAYGQWTWRAPRQSWIYRTDFAAVDHQTYYPGAMCLSMGLYSVTNWTWELGRMYDGYGTDIGSSPWRGGAPGGSCSNHTNKYMTHISNGPTPGNISVYQMFAYKDATRAYRSFSQMEGASVHLDDAQTPTVSAATSPGGWVQSATITTTVNARDAAPGTPSEQGGLGMFLDALFVPVEGGGVAQQPTVFGNCTMGRLSRCSESFNFRHTYNTEGDIDPNTAGNQRMPSGINAIYGDAYDAAGKHTRYQAGTVKIDRVVPNGTISGIESGELARDRDYAITATSTDPLSGSRSVQITLDGVEKATRTDCPANNNPCTLNWTLDGGDPALTEGTHTLRVNATDQVGNAATAARTFKVERTPPEFELDGTLLPTEGTGWVGAGEQDLFVSAADREASSGLTGATSIDAEIDGNDVAPPVAQDCAAGGCDLEAEFVQDTNSLAEGEHTLTVTVRDGAGNTESRSIPFKLERTPPTLTLAGTLKALEGQVLGEGGRYQLLVSGTDTGGAAMQSGLGRLSVAVDDNAADAVEQDCPFGACGQSRVYEYVTDEYEEGAHVITATATDLAGNETTEQFTINNPELPYACTTTPEPSQQTAIAAIPPDVALETFRNRLPEAFQASLPLTLDPDNVLQPQLDAYLPDDTFETQGSLNLGTIDREASDGATIRLETDYDPICLSPGQVSDAASAPTTPIAGTTVLFANAAPATDLAIRPTVTGTKTFTQIREPTAPTDFVWNLALQPDQELQKLSDGTVVVVEPLPGAEPSEPDPTVPPRPDIAQQRAAITNSSQQVQHASDAFQRVLEKTPDEIVAIIPKPWAIDALDRPVATTLDVTGSQQITMRVQHSPLTPYPVIVDPEVIMADSVDEYEARRADVNTAEYTDAEAETFQSQQPADFVYPDPPTLDPAYTDDEFEEYPLEDPAEETEGYSETDGDVDMAEASAAGRADRLPSIGLTESPPSLFYSPDRAKLSPQHYRPVVPWNIMDMIGSKNGRKAFRAKLWTDWVDLTRPGGRRGVETDAEQQNGIPSDVAIQAIEGSRGPRSVREYGNKLRLFLERYGPRVRHLAAWNEPNRNDDGAKNPTYRDPARAARFWNKAEELCHPKNGRPRCGFVTAGEYAGKGIDDRFRKGERRINYQKTYHKVLLEELNRRRNRGVPRKRKHAPRVWAYHAYADMSRFALNKKANKAPVSDHYYRKYRGKAYERPGGAHPKIWLTAVGSFYRRPCGKVPQPYRQDFCRRSGPNLYVAKFRQRDGVRKLLTRLTSGAFSKGVGGPGVQRLDYYRLQNVRSAAFYGGPGDISGRGRNKDGCCPAKDWGLVGSQRDPTPEELLQDENANVIGDKSAANISSPGALRLAFCVLRAARNGRLRNSRSCR